MSLKNNACWWSGTPGFYWWPTTNLEQRSQRIQRNYQELSGYCSGWTPQSEDPDKCPGAPLSSGWRSPGAGSWGSASCPPQSRSALSCSVSEWCQKLYGNYSSTCIRRLKFLKIVKRKASIISTSENDRIPDSHHERATKSGGKIKRTYYHPLLLSHN